jgi:hypothetical protein
LWIAPIAGIFQPAHFGNYTEKERSLPWRQFDLRECALLQLIVVRFCCFSMSFYVVSRRDDDAAPVLGRADALSAML